MNRLQHETSPYLLQHAKNPVDWYAWKPEAFEKANRENKPILVSIGYSTCHWCHVMERESFEDKEVAEYMNDHFVCIKVDREERPDVDQIYMEACQILTGSGGWPLNCFITPEKKPFYAGTYYPPMPKHNRPSWLQVLMNISHAFQNKNEVVREQASRLMEMIGNAATSARSGQLSVVEHTNKIPVSLIHGVYENLKSRFDAKNGGFGSAPKFPGTMGLHYLLDYQYFFGNEEAGNHVGLSLQKMIMGGIFDQVGGGISRYSTDSKWLVPHFEKMLYDNALLVSLLSEAFKVTKNPLYKNAIEETLAWVQREMTSPEGGFYSALDADSEGVEGKFYVWNEKEIDTLLGNQAVLFKEFYGVTSDGNWEGYNILYRKWTETEFAEFKGINIDQLRRLLTDSRQKLFDERKKRIHPGLDNKILLDWNSLMCSAYAKAYSALNEPSYRETAVKNLEFLLDKFSLDNGLSLYHTYKDGKAQYNAFFDDYAFLIEALLDVYEITFESNWLLQAERYSYYVLEHFFDREENLFYFTSALQQDLPVRRKDIYDAATPSGNSVMVRNFQRLSSLLGNDNFHEIAIEMLKTMRQNIEKYPSSFGRWATALLHEVMGIPEIAVVGKDANYLAQKIQSEFIPLKALLATIESNDKLPPLKDRYVEGSTLIYLCKDFTCQRPVKTMAEFLDLLNQYHK